MNRSLGLLTIFLMFPALAFGKGYFLTPNVETADKRLRVAGKTNLPEGSKIFITVTGESVTFMAQGDAIARNGSFNAGLFGPESGISDGNYTINLSALKPGVPENQWHTAKDMFETSVRLAVKEGRIGQFDSKSVATVRAAALNFAKKLSAMETQGRKMERLRNSTALGDMVSCSKTMHKLQPIADKYHQEAQGLPLSWKVPLGAAAIELQMCVSCSDNALEHCGRAKEYIAEGAKSINSGMR